MNEVKTIHLGRSAFTVAIDAQSSLQAYIKDIQKWGGKEVAEEVELRMAELLLERGFDEKKVVLASDIAYLREQLGEPKDFASEDDRSTTAETDVVEPTESKRLYRDTANGWFGGVAAGLSSYFGVGVWPVRIAFVLLAFAGFGGVLLYLILWILVPDAKTPSDRLQMQGKPVTVDTIKEYVANNPGITEMKQKAGSVLDGSWQATPAGSRVSRAIGGVIKGLLAFIGVCVLASGLAAAIGVLGVGTYLTTNPGYLFGASQIFPVGATETALLFVALGVALLICVVLSIMGLALIRRRWPLPGWITTILVVLMVVGGTVATAGTLSVGPRIADRYQAAHVTTIRTVPAFNKLDVTGSDTIVHYEPGDRYELVIKSVGNVDLSHLTSTTADGTLRLDAHGLLGHRNCSVFCINLEDVQITVRAPQVDSIMVSNEATVTLPERITQSNLTIASDGSGTFDGSYLYAQTASLAVNGSRRTLQLTGLQPAALSDTVRFDAYDMPIYIARADTVNYTSGKACTMDENVLIVGNVVGSIDIGNQHYANWRALSRVQNIDGTSPENCVAVSA